MSEPLRYYLDEHMRPAIAEQLRLRGIEVQTTVEAGQRGASDEEQLRHATGAGRVLVTEDSDFVQLSATLQPHMGIVYFPVQRAIGPRVEYLELLALTTAPEEIRNQLVYGRW